MEIKRVGLDLAKFIFLKFTPSTTMKMSCFERR